MQIRPRRSWRTDGRPEKPRFVLLCSRTHTRSHTFHSTYFIHFSEKHKALFFHLRPTKRAANSHSKTTSSCSTRCLEGYASAAQHAANAKVASCSFVQRQLHQPCTHASQKCFTSHKTHFGHACPRHWPRAAHAQHLAQSDIVCSTVHGSRSVRMSYRTPKPHEMASIPIQPLASRLGKSKLLIFATFSISHPKKTPLLLYHLGACWPASISERAHQLRPT